MPFAGTADDVSRSHFETQDTIELGQAAQGSRDYRSGFMSRLAAELTRVKPIAFTDQLPLIFRGPTQIPNIGINSVGKPGVDDRQARLIKSMYAGSDLEASVAEGFRVRDDVYRSISDEMTAANRSAVSPRGFELSARRIGRLMREQYNLGLVDVGGWDTHVNQGAATGYLADRLGELGRGLAGCVWPQRRLPAARLCVGATRRVGACLSLLSRLASSIGGDVSGLTGHLCRELIALHARQHAAVTDHFDAREVKAPSVSCSRLTS